MRGFIPGGNAAFRACLGIVAALALAHAAEGGEIGSGDGRIHVIPTLSAQSIKNGDTLSVQAIVKAQAGVASVEAVIERESAPATVLWASADLHDMLGQPVARLTLGPAPVNLGGVNATGTMGMWQAEWTAHGLVEAWYRVTVTVTDREGHRYSDDSLRFSDPIAGTHGVGWKSTLPTRVGAVTLNNGEDRLVSAVIDPASGHAWFGTHSFPGRVVKVALGAGSDPPTRVGAVTLNAGEDWLVSAVIDPASSHAYFGISNIFVEEPGRVVKVALGAGSDPPTRVGAVTLESGERYLRSAVIDPASGHAWFGTGSAPFGTETSHGRVVKVALGAGSDPPTRVGAVTLEDGEERLTSAVIDPASGYAWFGTGLLDGYTPGRVVKVALGAGSDPPTRVGAVTLEAEEGGLYSAVIDPASGHAWFGTRWGRVVKVALGTGSGPPARVGAVTLEEGEGALVSAVIDPASGYAYFGTLTSPGRVVKVALGAGSDPPTRVGAVTLEDGENELVIAVIDPASGHALFGTYTLPGRVVKVALGAGSDPPTRVGGSLLNAEENYLTSAVNNPASGHAWFGMYTNGIN